MSELHPFFQGLLDTLPEPGTDWPTARRDQWLETARNIFALIYYDPADPVTSVQPVEAAQHAAHVEPRFDQQSA